MKKILLISPYWKEPHRWMVSSVKLAELWQRLGYRVVVACMSEDMGGERERTEIVSPTLTIHRKKDFFLADPWNYGIAPGFTGFVRRIIRQEHPEIFVCNKILFWTSLSVIALRVTGRRVILLTDALVGMTWWGRTLPFRLASRLYAWTLGWLIMLCAEKIVFFHPQPERLLKILCVRKKSQVIPTGIDPAPYGRRPLASFELPAITITYTGRLESVKGVDDFLAAVVNVQDEHPAITVQVVGWYKEDHPLVVRYRDRVTFTGLREDIPEILSKTDIFVLPSYSEGLSNALMEAMASGCACIATDVGGNAYLIQNGVSGFLYPPGDREALQSHLRRLLEDPAKRKMMGEAARKRIDTAFSWNIVGEEYQKFFESDIQKMNSEKRHSP